MFILAATTQRIETVTLHIASLFSAWVTVFVDGKKSHGRFSVNRYGRTGNISKNTRVLGIKINDESGIKAFILSSSNGRILTNASWNCRSSLETNEDSSPAVESVFEDINNSPGKPNYIHPQAQWIWANNATQNVVFCKKTLIGKSPFSPQSKVSVKRVFY